MVEAATRLARQEASKASQAARKPGSQVAQQPPKQRRHEKSPAASEKGQETQNFKMRLVKILIES